MQPSSLVFLVIIGVWAAYFIQYWVRRREHLATVRAVDQFSESMRVLDREAKPESSARTSGANLLRRRAQVEQAAPSVPPKPAPASAGTTGPAPRRGGRRAGGLTVLAAVLALVACVPLVVLGLVPVMALAAPAALVLVGLVLVRRGVARDRRARTSSRRRTAPQHRDARPRVSRPATQRTVAPEPRVEVAPEPAAVAPEAAAVAPPEPFDVQAYEPAPLAARRAPTPAPVVEPEPAPEPARVHLVDDDDIPLTWDPVPVPRPTYTMKSRATRPAPTAADLVGDADTEYAAYEDQQVTRRVAGA